MADKEDKRSKGEDQRGNYRRITPDTGYTGPERRKGDRRVHERRNT